MHNYSFYWRFRIFLIVVLFHWLILSFENPKIHCILKLTRKSKESLKSLGAKSIFKAATLLNMKFTYIKWKRLNENVINWLFTLF